MEYYAILYIALYSIILYIYVLYSEIQWDVSWVCHEMDGNGGYKIGFAAGEMSMEGLGCSS